MKNLTKLYHFLYIVLAYFQHFQLLLYQEVDEISKAKLMILSQQFDYTSSSTENISMDMEIFAYPEHQSQLQIDVAQIESEVV